MAISFARVYDGLGFDERLCYYEIRYTYMYVYAYLYVDLGSIEVIPTYIAMDQNK